VTPSDSTDPAALRPRARLGVGAAIVVIVVALGLTVLIGVLRSAGAPVETVTIGAGDVGRAGGTGGSDAAGSATDDEAMTDAGAAASLFVHVSGAVVAPGIYVVGARARVVDAVAAAGGFAPDADRSAVNLARPVSDGEQLHVPVAGTGEPVAPATDAANAQGSGAGAGPVNLNTADASQLDALPRIGPAMAQRIIEWREANGRFTSVDDLLAVPGIGDKMLASLRELVSV
jgi:competence protein ComEA